jgi:uncharacterized membrane protein
LIDDEVKTIILIILCVSATVAVYPVIEGKTIIEPFSELGVLGPYGKMSDYPRELVIGQEFSLFLYVGNHEGHSEYYRVVAKVGDQTTNVSDSTPLDKPPLMSWETVLESGSNTTIPIKMSLGEVGLNKRLVFELWRYDVGSHVFIYYQHWTQLLLNVTAPS